MNIPNNKIAAYVERISKLMTERDNFNEDIREVYKEAKGEDFDVKALRATVAAYRKGKDKVEEEEILKMEYLKAVWGDLL